MTLFDIIIKFSQFAELYSYSFLVLFFTYYFHSIAELYSGSNFLVFYIYKPTRCTKFLWLDFIFH